MVEWFYNIDVSNQIAILAIIVSLFTSFVSIIIATISHIQTNRLYKESNRPIVVITLDSIVIDGFRTYYLIVKNYGNIVAKINSISCNIHLIEQFTLTSMHDTILAPNQSLVTHIDLTKINQVINFHVLYSDLSRTFYNTYEFNTLALKKLRSVDYTKSDYDALTRVIRSSFEENIKSKF